MASPIPAPSPTNPQPAVTSPVNANAAATGSFDATMSAALPPLTTPWINPLSCTWTYVVDHPDDVAKPGAVAFLDLEPMPGDKTLSCYPNDMFSHGRTGVFSPGTCPSGWTSASLYSDNNTPLTTTAICCSYGYILSGSACKRSVATALAVPIAYNTTAGTYSVLTKSTTTLYSALLAVSTIQVQFGEDDKIRLGIEPEKTDSSSSMSFGTCIGIAVGAGAFVLLSMGLVYLVLARRRRTKEGLTRERLMRDLKFMHRHGLSGCYGPCHSDSSTSRTNNSPHFAHEQQYEPPPAYDPRPRRISAYREDDNGGLKSCEIRVLNEQKAVIQRRLDELENLEATQERLREATNS